MQAFLISLFLFLHVMGAIITFGPTFVFPIIASQVQKDPRHGHFGAVLSELVQRRIIIPGAIVQGITGLVLFLLIGVDLTNPAWRWLGIGIILYLTLLSIGIFYQAPAARRMVEITSSMGPPPGASGPGPGGPGAVGPAAGGPPGAGATGAGSPPGGGPPGITGGRPAGPPPELIATGQKLRRGGQVMGLLIVIIVALMVVKPTLG